MNLQTQQVDVVSASSLEPHEIEELYRLFCTAFTADRAGFESDLKAKDSVLRIRREGRLEGFSTLCVYSPEPGVKVLFSGDTYVSPSGRVGQGLPGYWARYVFQEMPRVKGCSYYWLLLCSGYRTYRLLSTFFKEYFPGEPGEPGLAPLLERWATKIYGERYAQGIVTPAFATPLLDPEPSARLSNDPQVRFFLRANPGYRQGKELACLVSLALDNLSGSGRRLACP